MHELCINHQQVNRSIIFVVAETPYQFEGHHRFRTTIRLVTAQGIGFLNAVGVITPKIGLILGFDFESPGFLRRVTFWHFWLDFEGIRVLPACVVTT